MIEFLKRLILFFEKHHIEYMLSGSVAMSIYVLPRSTKDFDFVVHLKPTDMDALTNYFQQGYYCDKDAVKEAVRTGGMFNIIDFKSGYKADMIVLRSDQFRQEEFRRRKQVDFMNLKISVVTAEDLLISKLIWIQQLQSDIQKADIKELCKSPGLDLTYINYWISSLKLNTFGLLDK